MPFRSASRSRRFARPPRMSFVTLVLVPLISALGFAAGMAAETPPAFVRAWGTPGTGPGQFDAPSGIAIDASGNVYVADSFNNRIQKFDANGVFLLQWGGLGQGHGSFDLPWGVDCDAAGNVYVMDVYNAVVQKFTPSGQFLTQWSGPTLDASQLCVDDSANVYVADGYGYQIQKFRSDGSFVTKWGTHGDGPGQFSNASGVAFAGGRLYASDLYNGRIEVFDRNGNFEEQIGVPGGGFGQSFGELYYPEGLATDLSGNLYVGSSNLWTITKLAPAGDVLTQWGAPGQGPGQFQSYTFDVAVGPNGLVYVVDRGNARVQVFEPGAVPAQVATWGAIKDRYRK